MANLKNTSINDAQFRLPIGDTAARPGSPNGRQIRFNTETGKLEQFRPDVGDWIAPNNTGVIATGGDSVYDVDVEGTTYRVHVFTATGTSTFSVLQGGEVEYLIVAGGGGANFNAASSASGAGGGAGGLLTGKNNITSQTYTVTVGQGGSKPSSAGTPWNNAAGSGEDSNVFGITAIGGGHGGTWAGDTGGSGGSGGGRGGSTSFGTNGGSGTPGQGNDGGPGSRIAGAGGGAGSAGEFRDATGGRGNFGGIGISSNITGQSHFYAGGGSSGSRNSSEIAPGGLGGGGTGGTSSAGFGLGQNGTPNTGGGGGGGEEDGSDNSGGAGASGIVVIRYPLRQENPVTAPGRDVRDGLVLDLDFAKPTVYSGSGNVVTDSRLNGIEGDLVNGPAFVNPRTHRSAFEFDGGDTISIPNNQTTNGNFDQISIVSWFKLAQGADNTFRALFNATEDGIYLSNGYSVYLRPHQGAGSHIAWNINGDSYRRGTISADEWTFLVVTDDGINSKIYLDAQEVGSRSTRMPIQSQTDQEFIIGQDGSGSIARFVGSIADFLIYRKGLSQTEITDIYDATRWRFGV